MKGILLAGGEGSRLRPLTETITKHLLPVYDKPMIYYPLSTLMLAGIREILVIATPADRPHLEALLGDGSHFGLELTYETQSRPRGIADALIIGKSFLAGSKVAVILGDNILHGAGLGRSFARFRDLEGAQIFAYEVSDPRAYGVVEIGDDGKAISIEEKPAKPKSPYAIPGIYFYDNHAVDYAEMLKPSPRGELEISDLNSAYLAKGHLGVEVLPRGTAWLDAGTFESLLEAGKFVRTVQVRQGVSVLAPEEVAWRMGYINAVQLHELAEKCGKSDYGDYLRRLGQENLEGDKFWERL